MDNDPFAQTQRLNQADIDSYIRPAPTGAQFAALATDVAEQGANCAAIRKEQNAINDDLSSIASDLADLKESHHRLCRYFWLIVIGGFLVLFARGL